MLRVLMSALVLLTVSACGPLGLPTAVDAIPLEVRLATAPFADGLYCGLDEDEEDNSQLIVRSMTDEGDSACTTWTWDTARRLFVVTGESGGLLNTGDVAVADLGDGLLLMQFPQTKAEDDEAEKPWVFLLWTAMGEGEAVALVPIMLTEKTIAQVASYPGLTVSTHASDAPAPALPEDAPPGAEPPAPPTPVYYISAGAPEDIRNLARDIMVAGMRTYTTDLDSKNNLPEHGVFTPVLVRAAAGVPDHPPTPEQRRDIDALMERLMALGAR